MNNLQLYQKLYPVEYGCGNLEHKHLHKTDEKSNRKELFLIIIQAYDLIYLLACNTLALQLNLQ